MDIQNEKKNQSESNWKKYYSGWNYLINGLIAIIPATMAIVILKELGFRGALVQMGIMFGFMYLVGFLREKIGRLRKGTSKQESAEENIIVQQPTIVGKNRNSKKKWVWIGIVLVVLIVIIALASNSSSKQDVSLLKTDKSAESSEISGNLYRNTKYHFRIKFPEGWEIKPGDGLHIVQKANSENSTISIIIQQLELEGSEGITSIKDAGTSKEFIDTVIEGAKEKFSDVKIIDYGETKIDNEPAYWVEYSASSQVLDYQVKMTNLIYFLAKGDTTYSISAGTASDEYSKIKPLFMQTVSTFVLENY